MTELQQPLRLYLVRVPGILLPYVMVRSVVGETVKSATFVHAIFVEPGTVLYSSRLEQSYHSIGTGTEKFRSGCWVLFSDRYFSIFESFLGEYCDVR